jgi:hypothetical protein|tara:strand:- start:649 stop:861 length:213 start_codon:yes stop_codon:yes gene_type:complete
MNNAELDNTLIVVRRPKKENEFIFSNQCVLSSVEKMFSYIEDNSDLIIEVIDREELPLNQGYSGYRVKKK